MRKLLKLPVFAGGVIMALATAVAPLVRAGSNPANDRLIALSSDRQAQMLGQIVADGCTGRDAFYMGVEKSSGAALWSVRCLDGREFSVMFEPDSDDTQVLDCPILKAATNVECFKPLGQQ